MDKWTSRVSDHWTGQPGLVTGPGATERAIRKRAEELRVRFPEPLVALLAVVNGFEAGGDQDEEGFSFWQLSRLELVSEYHDGAFAYPGCHRHVLFCDYLGFSWAYAIDCAAESSTFGAVYIVGTRGERPPCAAPDLPTFMEFYIADDEGLYPGG